MIKTNSDRITITVEEGAKLLGCSINTFRNLMRSPNFPCVRVGRRILIPKEAFYEWFNNQAITDKMTL